MRDDQGQDTHWFWSAFFAVLMVLLVVNIVNQAPHFINHFGN